MGPELQNYTMTLVTHSLENENKTSVESEPFEL